MNMNEVSNHTQEVLKRNGWYEGREYEFNMMKNGMSYDNAHNAAKSYYNAMEFNFYHPEVIKQNPQLFNNAWFEFWGIERN